MANDQPEEGSRIQCAIRRISSVFKKREVPRSNSHSRLRSIKRDAPFRSALKDTRRATVSDDLRVSFADLLPHVDVGPPFRPFDEEPDECRGRTFQRAADLYAGLLARRGENRKRSYTDPTVLESAARHDSSVQQIGLPKKETPKSPMNSVSDPKERHGSLDRSRAMAGNSTDSQSKLWPRPLFANRPAGDRSSWPALGDSFDAQESAASRLAFSNWESRNLGSPVDELGHASAAYSAHVDRSLQSVRGNDRRRSAYLRDSLIQMQEALGSTEGEIGNNNSCPDEDETSPTRDQALLGPSNTEHRDTNAEKKTLPSSSNTTAPESTNSTPSVPRQTSQAAPLPVSLSTTESEVITNHNSRSDLELAQTMAPPPVPPRHPDRRLIHMINDLRTNVSADFAEEKESARDSGISM